MDNQIAASASYQVADALQSTNTQANNNTHDYVTVYTSDKPCNKRFEITFKDGIKKADKQPSFFSGTAVKRYVPTIEHLAAVIKEITDNPYQCWGNGFHSSVPVNTPYRILSEADALKAVEAGALIQDGSLYKDNITGSTVACRLKKLMSPSSYIIFDKDDGDSSLDQWIKDMGTFVPEFDVVDKIIIPSNSSRVGLKSDKWHCYVKIQEPMDIYSLSGRLLSAGNAAGHAVSKISKAGKELSRIITDCSVFSPERIIYDGKPTFNSGDVQSLTLEVTKGTVRSINTSLIKEVNGYGDFKSKKTTVIDANGNLIEKQIRKSTGSYDKYHLKLHTPVEMKLSGKVVTKTMQQVIDENLIELHGNDSGKIRCQSTFDDRDSKSFNGILRLGKDGKPCIYDQGAETTYIIGETTAEMFSDVEGFTDSTALMAGEVVEVASITISNDILQNFNGDHSHSDIADLVGEVYFFDNARYVHLYGKWFLWDGIRWVVDENLKHLSLIQEILKKRGDNLIEQTEARTDLQTAEHEKFIKWAYNEAKNLKSAPYKMYIESTIKTNPHCAVLPDVFDSNLKTIGTPIGTVNLVSGANARSQRDEYISKQTNVGANSSQPNVWLKFLDRIFDGDSELIAFIQRLCGYSMTGLTSEEKLFFLYGKGANGKSKFLEILFYILGDYARRAPVSMFAEQSFEKHPTELAGLKGARLVVCSELPDKMTWNEQSIKDLTGGDVITARLMRQDYSDYKPQFNILIAGNHKPRLRNVDESMARRMVLIPFSVTIPEKERDLQLSDKLKKEAGSILNWCVQGAVEYFKVGLKIPKSVSAASSDYLESEDRTGEFIESRLQKAPSQKVKFQDVFLTYQSWMKSQGFDFIKTEPDLRKELKERGFDIKRSNSIYLVNDYSLLPLSKPCAPSPSFVSFL